MSRFVVIYILCYEISAAFSLMIVTAKYLTFSVGFEQQSTEENRESAKPNYAIDNDAPCWRIWCRKLPPSKVEHFPVYWRIASRSNDKIWRRFYKIATSLVFLRTKRSNQRYILRRSVNWSYLNLCNDMTERSKRSIIVYRSLQLQKTIVGILEINANL